MTSPSSKESGEAGREPFLVDLLVGYGLLGLQPATVAALTHGPITPSGAVFLRFCLTSAFIALICVLRRRGLTTGQPKILFLRAFFGGLAVIFYFTSVAQAGSGRATILNYTYPLWANTFAVLLGARPKARFWWALAAAVVGVWLIVVPADGSGSGRIGWGELSGLLSGVFAGAAVLTIKKLRETDEALTVMAAFCAGGLLISLPDARLTTALPALADGALMLAAWGVGLTSFLGHFFFTRGYRGATLQQATLLSLLVPTIAATVGILFFDEPAGLRFFLGAGLVLAALAWGIRAAPTGRISS